MKKVIGAVLAVCMLAITLAGCGVDKEAVFKEMMAKQMAIKSCSQTVDMTFAVDDQGEKFDFLSFSMNAKQNIDDKKIAGDMKFDFLGISSKMDVFMSEDTYAIWMPVVCKYIQYPAQMSKSAFELGVSEKMMTMMTEEASKLYDKFTGVELSSSGSGVQAKFTLPGAAAKEYMAKVFTQIMSDEAFIDMMVEQSVNSIASIDPTNAPTDMDKAMMKTSLMQSMKQAIAQVEEMINGINLSDIVCDVTLDKNGYITKGSYVLDVEVSGVKLYITLNSTISDINSLSGSAITFPEFTDKNSIKLEDMMSATGEVPQINPFFTALSKVQSSVQTIPEYTEEQLMAMYKDMYPDATDAELAEMVKSYQQMMAQYNTQQKQSPPVDEVN